jgi:hypothetical protein
MIPFLDLVELKPDLVCEGIELCYFLFGLLTHK